MSVLNFPARLGITLVLGAGSFYIAREEFRIHRFLEHEMQPELQKKFEKEFDAKYVQLIERLKTVRHINYNVITPVAFFAQLAFHFLRLVIASMVHYDWHSCDPFFLYILLIICRIFEHRSQFSSMRNVIVMFAWSAIPTLVLSTLPYHLYVYPLVCSKDACKNAINRYLDFVMSSKDPEYSKYVKIEQDGRLTPTEEWKNVFKKE